MKNLDPYKRTILFVASLINVCLMTVLFVYVWYRFYQQTMYVIQFHRRGNYVIFMLYALLLFFFSNRDIFFWIVIWNHLNGCPTSFTVNLILWNIDSTILTFHIGVVSFLIFTHTLIDTAQILP